MDNIEKSKFTRDAYVGYSDGVWLIKKSNSSYGNWHAQKRDDPNQFIYAFTLKQMSQKLHDVHYNIMKAGDKNRSDNRKKNPRGSVADSTAAHELILYATNTDKLYPQKMSIVKNIMRRLANGTYDATKAVRLWQYWTDAAAQLYVKEFGTGRVDTVFTAATRRKAAAEIASIEIERIKNFEYGEIIPKRSRGKNPKKGSYAELKPRKEINFRIYAVDKKTGESKYLSTAINLLSAKIIAKAIAHRYPYSRIAVYKE